MRNFVFASLLGITLAYCSQAIYAVERTVTVDFEEFADALAQDAAQHNSNGGWSWNGTTGRQHSGLFPEGMLQPTGREIGIPSLWGTPLPENTFSSKDATFYWGGWDGQDMNYWQGTALSTVTDTTYMGYMNEMVTVPGSGNNGSQTYAVVYGDCMNNLPYNTEVFPHISLPTDTIVKSIAVANTVYTAAGLYGDLDGSGGWSVPSPPIAAPGDMFGLNIYGLDAMGDLIGSLTYNLGEWRDDAPWILEGWETIDLTSLAGATELKFSFYTTIPEDDSQFGFFTPAYFAYDDLTWAYEDGTSAPTPEPATLAILGLGLAGLGLVRRRKK